FIGIEAIDTVTQKNKYEVVFRINPKAGACKTGVAKRLCRSRSAGIGFCTGGIIAFGFIKPKSAAATVAMVLIKVIYRITAKKVLSVQYATIEQHLRKYCYLIGITKQSGMTGYTAKHGSAGVVHITM